MNKILENKSIIKTTKYQKVLLLLIVLILIFTNDKQEIIIFAPSILFFLTIKSKNEFRHNMNWWGEIGAYLFVLGIFLGGMISSMYLTARGLAIMFIVILIEKIFFGRKIEWGSKFINITYFSYLILGYFVTFYWDLTGKSGGVFFRYNYWFIAVILLLNFIKTTKKLKNCFYIVGIGTIINFGYLIYRHSFFKLFANRGVHRALGTMGDYASIGCLGMIFSLFFLYLFLFRNNKKEKFFLLLLFIINFFIMAASMDRVALGSFIIILFLILILNTINKKIPLYKFVALIFLSFCMFLIFIKPISRRVLKSKQSNVERLIMVESGLRAYIHNPIFGIGFGNEYDGLNSAYYRELKYAKLIGKKGDVYKDQTFTLPYFRYNAWSLYHNMYLSIICKIGLIGFIFWFFWFLAIPLFIRDLLKRDIKKKYNNLIWAVTWSLLSFYIFSTVWETWKNYPSTRKAALFLIFVLCFINRELNKNKKVSRK